MDKSVVDFINAHPEIIDDGNLQEIYDNCNYTIFSDVIFALLEAECDLSGGDVEEGNISYILTSVTREIVVLTELDEGVRSLYIDDVTEYRATVDENQVHFKTLSSAIEFLYNLHKQGMYKMSDWYPTMNTLNGNELVEVDTDQGIVYMLERGLEKLLMSE